MDRVSGDDDLLDPTGIPMAHHTSWFINPDGNFVLVLEDKGGKPIAAATYTWTNWMQIFRDLLEVHDQRETRR